MKTKGNAEKELVGYYEKLKKQGVTMPGETLWLGLIRLYIDFGIPVDKDEIARFIQKYYSRGKVSGDQQLRHIRRNHGWYVVGSGRGEDNTNHLLDGTKMPSSTYALLSVVAPHPQFVLTTRLTRNGRLNARDFEELKIVYENMCAICGKRKTLEQGHMDPRLPLTLQNTIPICIECNNWASQDMGFDENGRIIWITPSAYAQRFCPTLV